jgi:hypothetical protein
MCLARRNSFPSNSFPLETNRPVETIYFNEINNLIRFQGIRFQKSLETIFTGQKPDFNSFPERSLKRGGFVGNEFPSRRLWCARRQKKHTRTRNHIWQSAVEHSARPKPV